MNKKLDIEFSPDRYSYYPGQHGKARIKFNNNIKVKDITLSLNQVSNRLKTKNVAKYIYKVNNDSTGNELDIDFQLPRNIPSTFKGVKLKLAYQWHIHVDIAWAMDSQFIFPMKIQPMPLKGKALTMFMRTTSLPEKKKGFFNTWSTKIAFFFFSLALALL